MFSEACVILSTGGGVGRTPFEQSPHSGQKPLPSGQRPPPDIDPLRTEIPVLTSSGGHCSGQ